MKSSKVVMMIMLFLSMQSLQATTTSTVSSGFTPTTEDKLNPELLNTLPAVNILNLSGVDCDGLAIQRFVIRSLPSSAMGILYLANGETVVTLGQYLSKSEADGLRFDPKEGFTGNAIFTYSSVDIRGLEDASPATVTIPVSANGGGDNCPEDNNGTVVHTTECTCEAYNESIPSLSGLGLLLLLSFTLLLVKREI